MFVKRSLSGLVIFLVVTIQVSGQSFEWKTGAAHVQGFSEHKLTAMLDTLRKHGTEGLLMARKDQVVLEWYDKDWPSSRIHGTASLAKATVGGMALLVALTDKRLSPDDPASDFITQWKDDSLKSRITIRQLATHSSGIEDAEITKSDENGRSIRLPHMQLPGWKGDFWRQDPDPFSVSRDHAAVLFSPGTAYQYSNPGIALLSYAITASYKGTEYKDLRTLLRQRVYEPIGIKKDEWMIGYNKTFHVDDLDLVANWGGAAYTVRATARIGRLMMRKGNWDGKQLIDSSWVKRAIAYSGTSIPPRHEKQPAPAATMGWYCNFDGIWQRAPRDTFCGAGAQNQLLIVIPSLDMIIVRYGRDMADPQKDEGFFYGVEKYLVNMAMDAVIAPPYPKSEAIRTITFGDTSSIVRRAHGSDNWPMTWADDNNLYAAYGDGNGFKPNVEKKLSLGLAKIMGGPEDFQGVNIRSETGEQIGQGRNGKKASGMLMVNGVLYMWIRNANNAGENSQLAWSADHGRNWFFAPWQFTESFAYPTFLNFGKNYSDARDKYVYIYSHDERDAYKVADAMVLARVPKNKIQQRDAYQFFSGLNDNGKPQWSTKIADRKPVFSNPGGCYRSGISYNKGLKRYLWCQALEPSTDPQGARFQGGFGIYEAPEPWGPWRTVYYTKDWDVGPGESSSFPTKWMSADGKTCYLVFSGDDAFSVRKVSFN